MTADAVFPVVNLVAVVGWVLLIAAPRSRLATAAAGTVIPLVLAVVYLALFAVNAGSARGGFSTLAGVAGLFSNPWLLLAGWVHYLAFDLCVGTWEARDAIERGVSRWLLAPCLFLTFMLGPIGLLAYNAVLFARRGDAPAFVDRL